MWPIDRLQEAGLPLKPLDRVLPYSAGITVEHPEPVGDYKAPDGRFLAGVTGRLVELFTDGVPTVCLSLYLSPHAVAVADAVRIARSTGLPVDVTTVAQAVGSDVTNIVLDRVDAMSPAERAAMERRARSRGQQLDGTVVFDRVLARLDGTRWGGLLRAV